MLYAEYVNSIPVTERPFKDEYQNEYQAAPRHSNEDLDEVGTAALFFTSWCIPPPAAILALYATEFFGWRGHSC